MSTTGSIGGLIVWTSQCLAYLRYHHWFHGFKKRKQLPPEYNRWHPQPVRFPWHESRPLLASIQPVPAWLGLIGCLLIVTVLTSATWWNGEVSFTKVAEAYAGVCISLFPNVILWLILTANHLVCSLHCIEAVQQTWVGGFATQSSAAFQCHVKFRTELGTTASHVGRRDDRRAVDWSRSLSNIDLIDRYKESEASYPEKTR